MANKPNWIKGVARGLSRVVGAPKEEVADHMLFWGMRDLPFSDATQRFLVVGSPGSGKTTLLELLMRTTLGFITKTHKVGINEIPFDHRALIFDAKRDMLPILARMGFSVEPGVAGTLPEVRTLNPFDERCFAWDIAADVRTPAAALQVASILIPAEPNASQPFWTDAARHLVYGTMLSFIARCDKRWTLRHLVQVLSNVGRLKEVLLNCEHTQDLVGAYLEDQKVSADMMSTLATKLFGLGIVAALWDKPLALGRGISLEKWLSDRYILVLGSHPANAAALRMINQAIFRRLTDLLLTQDEVSDHSALGRKTWLFLDEVREAGKLDGLSSILNQGRSKGVCTVLGFQDVAGMISVYGEQLANELLGQCDNKVFLRTDSHATAAWAESHLGKDLVRKFSTSLKEGSQDRQISQAPEIQPHILASEIATLPRTNPQNGLWGYVDSPIHGDYLGHLDWDEILKRRTGSITLRPAPRAKVADEVVRTDHEQYMSPWGLADNQLVLGKSGGTGSSVRRGEGSLPDQPDANDTIGRALPKRLGLTQTRHH